MKFEVETFSSFSLITTLTYNVEENLVIFNYCCPQFSLSRFLKPYKIVRKNRQNYFHVNVTFFETHKRIRNVCINTQKSILKHTHLLTAEKQLLYTTDPRGCVNFLKILIKLKSEATFSCSMKLNEAIFQQNFKLSLFENYMKRAFL